MADYPKVDVVTVGAGWTAAMLASKLCPAGYEMVSIEQGPERWTWPDFAHNHDSLRYSGRYAMMVDLDRETVDVLRDLARRRDVPFTIETAKQARKGVPA